MRPLVEGTVLAILSLIAIWGVWQVPAAGPGDTWAGIVPFIAALALLALSGLVAIGDMRAKDGASAGRESDEVGAPAVLILLAVALLYQQSFRWFGYILPTAVVAPVVLYIFGVRNWFGLGASVPICPLTFHVVFFEALGVFPPHGELLDLLDWIRG